MRPLATVSISALVILASVVVTSVSLPPVGPLALQGCSGVSRQDVKSIERAVLTAEQLSCIFASALLDSKTVADTCNVAKDLLPSLLPTIDALIGQREGAKRAGVGWAPPKTDGGSSTSIKDAAAKD